MPENTLFIRYGEVCKYAYAVKLITFLFKNNYMGKIRGTHSSPGIYTKFTDVSVTAKSLGITTLAIVGETLKGPAFEPTPISNWDEFVEYFGETSAEKFVGSKYPKYEGPYIAKEYLTASDQMYVCRVLGLSGYNAGPAFLITAERDGETDKHVIAVLRSRGGYSNFYNVDRCDRSVDYDTLGFACDEIEFAKAPKTVYSKGECVIDENLVGNDDWSINPNDYGRYVMAFKKNGEYVGKPVTISLNPGDKDYIYNILGSKPHDVDNIKNIPVFVEEFYDLMLYNGSFDRISSEIKTISETAIEEVSAPVKGFAKKPINTLVAADDGREFLYDGSYGEDGFVYYNTDDNGVITEDFMNSPVAMKVGYIYRATSAYINGVKRYIYIAKKDENGYEVNITPDGKPMPSPPAPPVSGVTEDASVMKKSRKTAAKELEVLKAVKLLSDDHFYVMHDKYTVSPLLNPSHYFEQYRNAVTPWVVSEVKGDGYELEVYKLFRFHTISDGNNANSMVKISILNVSPDTGRFDLYVRDFNDTDASPKVLESYRNLTMVPGDKNYIGLRIGTLDGSYMLKSKHVIVEINDTTMTRECVPCGFLGYPVRSYGEGYKSPNAVYNTVFDKDNIKPKKQYFGLSDITGIDVDLFKYKGVYTGIEGDYTFGYTNAFHLDSRLGNKDKTITVDGDEDTVNINWTTVEPNMEFDVVGACVNTEAEMFGTMYEDKIVRKFTLCPYGGFDGWDIYRTSRSNTDDFRYNNYKGVIGYSKGRTFSKISNPELHSLDGACINSDYYAYLSGAMMFENPEKYSVNIFVTPGIDYVNNYKLVDDILDMIEESRGDSIYIVTTPDKPFGANDGVDDMYTQDDVVELLDASGIDSYYVATYYPWCQYFDKENSIYINLPVTRDVVRNMADVDNKKYPWYAPAGTERGNVKCEKARLYTKTPVEDVLYDGMINPVKSFAKDGVKVWGNKTVYRNDTSPMNRINVVRMMLYMRKLIIESSRALIFEQNDSSLAKTFEGIVKPLLNQIKKDRGLYDFVLQVSQTPEQIDAHELSAKLLVKPTPTLEYIEIEFVVSPTSVDFNTL